MGRNDPLPLEHYHEHWGKMPAPKFATPRDFTAPTLGGQQGIFSRDWLGSPFLPFQQYIADVCGEREHDPETGLWLPRYSKCVITIQRQAGKSHMAMARTGERCMSVPHWRAWYTAQTGQDARDQFLKFHEEIITGAPLENVVKLARGRGEEKLTFPRGSTIRPHPPTEEKLHGKQGDSNDIDEAWAFSREEGQALMQAGAPTKLTRPHAQTWIWSAGGTADSTWLADLVAEGREGTNRRVAYIEFGIPDDADAEDLDIIAAYHPAFEHTVTRRSLEVMREDIGDDAAGWARAAGNRWTEIIGGAIGAEDWQAMQYRPEVPAQGRVGYGAARSVDGSEVAIVAAIEVGDLTVVEVLDILPTAYGAAEHILGWATDGPVGIHPDGPSGSLAAGVRKLNERRLVELSGAQASVAVTDILDSVPLRAIRFRPHPALDAAVQVAGTRPRSDGGVAWARRAAGAPIAALEAAGKAVWALRYGPRQLGKPRIITAA